MKRKCKKAQEQQEFYSHRPCSFSNHCPNLPPGSSRQYDASIAAALLSCDTDLLPNKISLKGQHGITAGLEPEKTSSLHKQALSSLCPFKKCTQGYIFLVLSANQCSPLRAKHNQRVINTSEGCHIM